MKRITLIGLLLGIICASAPVLGAEQFRTDINPAMLYYQAFNAAPDLSQADRDYLYDYREEKLSAKFGDLAGRFDGEFKLIRQAALATVPCDWGIDFSPGPFTLLPHLAKAKLVAQAARWRAMRALQQGRPADARDELLATVALARNLSRDGVLISALVQVAMEGIVISTVAENFHRFSPEMLREIKEGIAASPARGTMAACIKVEMGSFAHWLEKKILDLQKEFPADDARVMAGITELVASFQGEEQAQTNRTKNAFSDEVAKVAGGTSDGVLKLVREEDALYARLEIILGLPYPQYEEQMRPFSAEVQASPNPLISMTFPAFDRCRQREFGILAELAMLQAGIEYKLHGSEGLKSASDPFGRAPFEFRRFTFESVDRGFQLRSAYNGRGFPQVLIFVEKDGPPFRVNGPKAGQALPKPSNSK